MESEKDIMKQNYTLFSLLFLVSIVGLLFFGQTGAMNAREREELLEKYETILALERKKLLCSNVSRDYKARKNKKFDETEKLLKEARAAHEIESLMACLFCVIL